MQLDFSEMKLLRNLLLGWDVLKDPRVPPLLQRLEAEINDPKRFAKSEELVQAREDMMRRMGLLPQKTKRPRPDYLKLVT